MSPTRFALLEINPSARITSIATGGDVLAYVTSEGPITFVDLPDPLPESDHTNDDANAADDENVTGFPPVDDLTDGARGWRAGFAAAACAVAIVHLVHPHLPPGHLRVKEVASSLQTRTQFAC